MQLQNYTKIMKTKSNRITDIVDYIHDELKNKYPQSEIKAFINILFQEYVGINSAHILAFKDDCVNESELLNIVLSTERLKKYEPIQYIIGRTEFCGLKIKVTSDVLIPRPETEEMVYEIINTIRQNNVKHQNADMREEKNINIIDLCTGSGCIALALDKNIKNSNVSGVDISDKALVIAKENNNNLACNVNFYKYDVLSPSETQDKYDIIVSNPPYVLEREKIDMKRNVLDYEPHLALFVKNENPLQFYEKIEIYARKNLKIGGKIFLEVNNFFVKDTLSLFSEKEYIAQVRKDIFNRERFIFLQKKS